MQQSMLEERHDSAPAANALPSSEASHKYFKQLEIDCERCFGAGFNPKLGRSSEL